MSLQEQQESRQSVQSIRYGIGQNLASALRKNIGGLELVRLCWLHVSNVLKQRAIASLNLMWLLKTKEPFLCMNRLDLSSLEEIPKDFAPA